MRRQIALSIALMLALASAGLAQEAKPRQSGRPAGRQAGQPTVRQPEQGRQARPANPPTAQRPQRQPPQASPPQRQAGRPADRPRGEQPRAVPREQPGRGGNQPQAGSPQNRGNDNRRQPTDRPPQAGPHRPPGIYSDRPPMGPQIQSRRFSPRNITRYAVPRSMRLPQPHPQFGWSYHEEFYQSGPYGFGYGYRFFWRPFPDFWRWQHRYICVPGYWEWDDWCQCHVWIRGFCNVPGHRHPCDSGFDFWYGCDGYLNYIR